MPQLYDAEKHKDLTARHDVLVKGLEEAKQKCNDLYLSDKEWDAKRLAAYQAEGINVSLMEGEVSRSARALEEMDARKPLAKDDPRRESLLNRFFRRGANGISAEERSAMDAKNDQDPWGGLPAMSGAMGIRVARGSRRESARAANTEPQAAILRGDQSSGDDYVPVEHRTHPIDSLAAMGGIRRACQILPTSTGADIEQTRVDATAEKGKRITGGGVTGTSHQTSEDETPDPAKTTLKSYIYTSNRIPVSLALIQDAGFDIEAWLMLQANRRICRIQNEEFTTATGTDRPEGVVGKAKAGLTTAANDAFTWQELLRLSYQVNAGYLEGEMPEMAYPGLPAEMGGMIGYMMSRDMEGKIRELAAEGAPLWQAGLTAMAPNMLHGYPYVLNHEMDDFAAGKVPLLFGNFSYHVIRDVTDMMIFAFLDSATAQNYSKEIVAFARADSKTLAALDSSGVCQAFAKMTIKT